MWFIAGAIKPIASLFRIEKDVAEENSDKKSEFNAEGDDED